MNRLTPTADGLDGPHRPPLANGTAGTLAEPAPSRKASAPQAPASSPPPAELVIRPSRGWIGVDWRELVRSREILYYFVWRDVKVRYKQTVLGMAWGVIQPLLMMVIFSVIFGRFAKIPSDGLPYSVFIFGGLLPWLFFSNGLSQGGMSLINQQKILSKVYLPRLYIPTAAALVFLVDLAASFALYAVILAWHGIVPSWGIVLVPGLILLDVLLTLGGSFLLSALVVQYRDFRYIIPFLVQILLYVSPVIYPASMLPNRLQAVLMLNPLVGIIEGFRSAILGTPWNIPALAASVVVTLAVFVLGLYSFRRVERRFADIA